MKILYVGKFKRPNATEHSVARGFTALGHNVAKFDYTVLDSNKLLGEASTFHDLVLFSKSINVSLETIKKIKTKKAMWIFDGLRITDPNKLRSDGKPILERAKLMNVLFTVSHGDLKIYREFGCNAKWLPQAVDETIYKHHPIPRNLDLVFVANQNGDFRKSFIKKLRAKKFKVNVFGGNWGIPNNGSIPEHEAPKIYSRAKIALGMGESNLQFDQFSKRVWVALGSRTVLLHKHTPSLLKIFKNWEHLVLWRDEQECHKFANKILNNPALAKSIANSGYKFVHKNHTYKHRAIKMLAEMGKI